ncbi:hypothetical protein HPB51_004738 [Rhipicephalus microplus]|uniref:Uncharacterized protein n=1 Tax=Rhipicephalus microplus TaxID=6941 RepID=A0A9J6DSN3_RHIMP|nr:hypothetical protein HPB51_004738 [Rhipicephalus microplus]
MKEVFTPKAWTCQFGKLEIFVPCRWVLTAFLFSGLLLAYALRFSLSVALVAMVNQTASAHDLGPVFAIQPTSATTISAAAAEPMDAPPANDTGTATDVPVITTTAAPYFSRDGGYGQCLAPVPPQDSHKFFTGSLVVPETARSSRWLKTPTQAARNCQRDVLTNVALPGNKASKVPQHTAISDAREGWPAHVWMWSAENVVTRQCRPGVARRLTSTRGTGSGRM